MSAPLDRVLIVEDDEALRSLLHDELTDTGLDIRAVADAEAARTALGEGAADLVVSDLRLPGASGLDLLRATRDLDPAPAFLVVTAFGTIDQAVQCLKEGADDFLTKPLDLDHLAVRIARVLENRRLRREVLRYRKALDAESFHGMVGRSAVMEALYDQLRHVARGHGPVLVEGESGVGKELAARAIHAESERHAGPFLAVNCAGVPDSLLESEFFGHVEGAFSGATRSRPGLFQEADGGTLLLDEIGEMSGDLQAKLLRVLEEGEVRPVGSDQAGPVDVRVLAATHRDPSADDGPLRRDLFYRLATFRVSVPPLRRREGDLDLLTARFVQRHAARLGREPPEPSGEFLARLRSHPFPGNVRELENVVERAVTFCEGRVLKPRHLPERIRSAGSRSAGASVPEDLEETLLEGDMLPPLRELGDRYIRYVLDRLGGNKRRAAALLGISRRTLYRRLDGDPS